MKCKHGVKYVSGFNVCVRCGYHGSRQEREPVIPDMVDYMKTHDSKDAVPRRAHDYQRLDMYGRSED